MVIDKIIVTLASISGILFTFWFFLRKNEKAIGVRDSFDIVVEGGYTPEIITVPKDKLTKLNFIRKDPSSCLEEIVMPDFKIRKTLPLNQKTVIELVPTRAGEFVYSCGMNMYHGKIIVK